MKHAHTDSAIYAIYDENFDDASLKTSPFDITSTVTFNPRHITPRITNQSGLFTVHPDPENVYEHDGLCKWIIKNECKTDIRVMLRSYKINYSTLFPSIEGVAKLLKSNYGLV